MFYKKLFYYFFEKFPNSGIRYSVYVFIHRILFLDEMEILVVNLPCLSYELLLPYTIHIEYALTMSALINYNENHLSKPPDTDITFFLPL